MIKLCTDYFRLILFCSGLLIGIQIPAVVDQYAKRVDAQLLEATDMLAGFQQTADRYFDGDIADLISHYKNSDDPVFKNDATNILFISDRVTHLQAEKSILARSSLVRTAHVLFNPDKNIFKQTIEQYSYVVLINPQALIWGLISGLIAAALVDALFLIVGLIVIRQRKKSIRAQSL